MLVITSGPDGSTWERVVGDGERERERGREERSERREGKGGGGGAEEEDGIHVIIDNIYSRMQVYIIYDVIECSMFAMIVISSS